MLAHPQLNTILQQLILSALLAVKYLPCSRVSLLLTRSLAKKHDSLTELQPARRTQKVERVHQQDYSWPNSLSVREFVGVGYSCYQASVQQWLSYTAVVLSYEATCVLGDKALLFLSWSRCQGARGEMIVNVKYWDWRWFGR